MKSINELLREIRKSEVEIRRLNALNRVLKRKTHDLKYGVIEERP